MFNANRPAKNNDITVTNPIAMTNNEVGLPCRLDVTSSSMLTSARPEISLSRLTIPRRCRKPRRRNDGDIVFGAGESQWLETYPDTIDLSGVPFSPGVAHRELDHDAGNISSIPE